MRTQNCYCGLVAYANCTRCGQGVCYDHHQDEQVSPWFYRNYGQGKTLAEAAYTRGYWTAKSNRFICKGCRDKDGRAHSRLIVNQSRGWPKDPFKFVLSAACLGYVITHPGISYSGIIQSWLNLNWQPTETINVPRLMRPAKTKRTGLGYREVKAAQYNYDKYPGWSFPRTVSVRGESRLGPMASWSASTDILTDGRVRQGGEFVTQPFTGASHRLIVEMARRMFIARGQLWQGPAENWDT